MATKKKKMGRPQLAKTKRLSRRVFVKLTPTHHRALLETKIRLGAELENEEALEEARNSAVEYNVDGAGGRTILGLYHIHRDEIELAVSAFRMVVEAQPTDTRALTRLGQCLHTLEKHSEARRYYEQAIRVNPDEGAAHRSLAVTELTSMPLDAA